jgi:hypothetical protein
MVGKEVYTLNGRDIEIRGLTFIERAPIRDQILERYLRVSQDIKNTNLATSIAMGLELSINVVKMGTGLKDSELEDIGEEGVMELAAAILNTSNLFPDVKKK